MQELHGNTMSTVQTKYWTQYCHIELQREPDSEHHHHLFLMPSKFTTWYD